MAGGMPAPSCKSSYEEAGIVVVVVVVVAVVVGAVVGVVVVVVVREYLVVVEEIDERDFLHPSEIGRGGMVPWIM